MPHKPLDIPIGDVAKTTRTKGIAYLVHHLCDPYEVPAVEEPVTITAKEHNHLPEESATDNPRPGAVFSSANQFGFAPTEAQAWEMYEDFCSRTRPTDAVRLYRYETEVFDENYSTIRQLLAQEVNLDGQYGCTLEYEFTHNGFERLSLAEAEKALLQAPDREAADNAYSPEDQWSDEDSYAVPLSVIAQVNEAAAENAADDDSELVSENNS